MKRTLLAANREEIEICGAVFLRLTGSDSNGVEYTAPVMVYVSPSTQRFYLSHGTLIQLGVISCTFPRVGGALEQAAVEHEEYTCGYLKRVLPPRRPDTLPFPCRPENNDRFKTWLIKRFKASTFNKCSHQKLAGMSGPDLQYHMMPNADAEAKPLHTPAMVPLH